MIPTIIHQTWKDHDIPLDFRTLALSWKNHHPQWEYRFWTDQMNRAFIREHYPSFLDRYDGYATNIERVDAVRYFVLHKYGGIYIDMDFECLASIAPLLKTAKCLFGKEPDAHCRIHDKELIISNAFMASAPGSSFFAALCEELANDRFVTDHPNNRILETTGPFMLTRVYAGYINKEEIEILDSTRLYPLTKEELEAYSENGISDRKLEDKLKDAYGIHHYAGTWWKKNGHSLKNGHLFLSKNRN